MLTFFTVCAVAGVVTMVCQVGMTLFGLDGDHSDIGDIGDDLEVGDEIVDGHHAGPDFVSILSFRSLVAFIAFFGLVGRLMLKSELAAWLAIFGASAAGIVSMLIVAWVMRALHSLKEDGTLQIENCIGKPGTVYLSIPKLGEGRGKITVSVQNSEHEFEAVTDSADDIPTGTAIVVVGIGSDNCLEVQPEPNLNAIRVDI